MQKIIDEKLAELKSLGYVNREFRVWVDQSNLWYWIYSSYAIEGTPLERGKIVAILDGQIVEDAPIDAYNLIQSYNAIYKDMRSSKEMDQDLDIKMLLRWGEALTGSIPEFRKGNPVVFEWNHIPPVAAECRDNIAALLRLAGLARRSGFSVADIANLYLEFLKEYPFDHDTMRMGGLVLAYSLMREGYPLPGLSINDVEYNKMIDAFVNQKDASEFVSMLERCVLNRIDSVLMLCKQAKEIEDENKE